MTLFIRPKHLLKIFGLLFLKLSFFEVMIGTSTDFIDISMIDSVILCISIICEVIGYLYFEFLVLLNLFGYNFQS
jgi:hypothetical protein